MTGYSASQIMLARTSRPGHTTSRKSLFNKNSKAVMSKKKKVLVLPFFSRSLAILHKNGKRVASQTSTPTKSLAVVNLVLLLLGLRRDCDLLPSWCRICRKLFAKIFLESGCFPFAILPAKATRVTGPLQQQRHNHIN